MSLRLERDDGLGSTEQVSVGSVSFPFWGVSRPGVVNVLHGRAPGQARIHRIEEIWRDARVARHELFWAVSR